MLKEGKLDFDDLKKIIFNNKTIKRDEVKIRNDIGEDCAVIDFGENEAVFSTDPITGAGKNSGRLAVHINCNDAASAGAEPIGLLVTILAPVNSTLAQINEIMSEIDEEASKINVEIIGGHTEVTSAVNKMVISVTVIGKNPRGKSVSSAGACVGDDIIVTKSIGIEGTCILVNDHEERLKKVLSEEEIEQGKALIDSISVLKEGRIAGKIGVHSMHDITEGGLLGGIFEIASAAKVGFEIYKDKVPVIDVTKKVCKEFGIDYLRLIASGSMLIISADGKKVVEELKKSGVNAAIVGKIIKKGGYLINNNTRCEVEAPKRDELFNIK